MSDNTGNWKIAYPDSRTEKKIKLLIDSDSYIEGRWEHFENDVSNNPFYHPKPRRIMKLKGITGYPPGTFRYKNEPLRVLYLPNKETKTVYPLEANTTNKISYKKR